MKYGLMLNDMRFSNIENLICVKVSTNRQELVDYHESMRVPQWMDSKWQKSFRQDSELEWFNPSSNLDGDNEYFGGIYAFPDDAPDEAIMNFTLSKR